MRPKETLYRKFGRRYQQVTDPYALDGLPPGAWLVVVNDGFVSTRKQIDPAWNAVDAALKLFSDELVSVIRKVSEVREVRPYTAKQKALIDRMRKELGDEMFSNLEYPSNLEVAEAISDWVRTKIVPTSQPASKGVPVQSVSCERLFKFSYKHPKKRKLRYWTTTAYSFQEADNKAPKEIDGGYLRYGVV